MSYPHIYIDHGSFLCDEELKVDGSNFIDWYQRLRGILYVNDVLHVIQEPLGDAPDDSASEEEYEEYSTRRTLFIVVQCTMLYSMELELRVCFKNTNTYDMTDELKALFISQVKVAQYECLDEFLSMKIEENTCLDSHLAKMHGIHKRLVDVFDY